MRNRRNRNPVLAVGACAALLLGACGNSGGEDNDNNSASPDTVTPSPRSPVAPGARHAA